MSIILINCSFLPPSQVELYQQFLNTSDRVTFCQSTTTFFTSGVVYVVEHRSLEAPNMWVKASFPKDTSAELTTIGVILGPLQSVIIASGTLPVFCYLQKNVLLPYVLVDLGVMAFIVALVPETTHVSCSNIVINVWSQHWFWKNYVKKQICISIRI